MFPSLRYLRAVLFSELDESFVPVVPKSIPEEWERLHSEVLNHIEKNSDQILVIIGGWGHGKSTFVSYFLSKLGSDRKVVFRSRRVSFIYSEKIDDAYMHLLAPSVRLMMMGVSICAAMLIASKLGANLWAEFFIALVVWIFGFNGFRLAYIVGSMIDAAFSSGKASEVVVIEDLERGCLPRGDQFLLLANRWKPNKSYIVTYGFDAREDRFHVVDFCRKLNARIIELPLSVDNMFKIAKTLDPDFPFEHGKWMIIFSPRNLVKIIEEIRRRPLKNSGEMQLRYYQVFYKLLKIAFAIEQEPAFLVDSPNSNSLRVYRVGNDSADKVLEHFAKSIKYQTIGRAIDEFDSDLKSEYPQSAANWMDRVLTDAILGKGKFSSSEVNVIAAFCQGAIREGVK